MNCPSPKVLKRSLGLGKRWAGALPDVSPVGSRLGARSRGSCPFAARLPPFSFLSFGSPFSVLSLALALSFMGQAPRPRIADVEPSFLTQAWQALPPRMRMERRRQELAVLFW